MPAGGAIYVSQDGTCRLTGNLFIDNQATGAGSGGGGLYLYTKAATIENNFFAHNTALMGGGMSGVLKPSASTWKLTNNTLWHNNATGQHGGGGAYIGSYTDGATITITNNIIRDNSSGGPGDDLRVDTDSDQNNTGTTVNLNYNLLGPHTSFASGHSDDLYITNTGNYHHHANGTDDPRLKTDGHLPSGSPAINKGICGRWFNDMQGHRFYYRTAPMDDRDGDPRPGTGATGGCDIGADEYRFPWPMFLPAIVRPHLNPYSIPVHPGF